MSFLSTVSSFKNWGKGHFLLAQERWHSGVGFNPFSRKFTQNPYPFYAELRHKSPVHRSLLSNTWVLTRHKDVMDVLQDYERFSNNPHLRNKESASLLPPGPDDYSVLLLDPPKHTQLRQVVGKGFSSLHLKELEPKIKRTLESLIEDVGDAKSFDLVHQIARPLAMATICDLLGVPDEDRAFLEKCSRYRAQLLELTVSVSERERAKWAGKEMGRYFLSQVEQRRVHPCEDLISLLANAGSEMTADEAVDMLAVLLVAGNETTANLIGNGMLALIQNPEQMEVLQADRKKIPSAVEEMLRYDGPVQVDFRVVKEDCQIGGVSIMKGSGLLLLLGAANHDSEVFEEGDAFNIERKSSKHLAFGKGIHHCVGAPLARLEARLALDAILSHWPKLQLNTSPRFSPNSVVRGLESLQVCSDK